MWIVHDHVLCPRLVRQLCSVFMHHVLYVASYNTATQDMGRWRRRCCARGVARSSNQQVSRSSSCAAQRHVGGGPRRRVRLPGRQATQTSGRRRWASTSRSLFATLVESATHSRRRYPPRLWSPLPAPADMFSTSSDVPLPPYRFGKQYPAKHAADMHVRSGQQRLSSSSNNRGGAHLLPPTAPG